MGKHIFVSVQQRKKVTTSKSEKQRVGRKSTFVVWAERWSASSDDTQVAAGGDTQTAVGGDTQAATDV